MAFTDTAKNLAQKAGQTLDKYGKAAGKFDQTVTNTVLKSTGVGVKPAAKKFVSKNLEAAKAGAVANALRRKFNNGGAK